MRTKYKLYEIAIYINWYNINCEIMVNQLYI